MRHLLLILLLLLPVPSWATETQVAADTFSGGDGGLGGNWTTVSGMGNPTVASGVVQPASAGGSGSEAIYSAGTFADNQYVQQTVVKAITSNGRVVSLVLRGITASRTMYECRILGPLGSTATINIIRLNAGTPTTLATTAADQTVNVNDIHKCTVVGSTIKSYINGTEKLSIDDGSPISSGKPGILIFSSGATTDTQLDTWSAGDITADAQQSPMGFLGVILK